MRPVARRGGDCAARLQSTTTPTRSPVCDARGREGDAQGGRLHGPKQRRRGLVGAALWAMPRLCSARADGARRAGRVALSPGPARPAAASPCGAALRSALSSRDLRRRRQARGTSPSRRGHARAGAVLQLGAGAGLPCVPADPVVGPSWFCARCRRRPIAACSSPLLLRQPEGAPSTSALKSAGRRARRGGRADGRAGRPASQGGVGTLRRFARLAGCGACRSPRSSPAAQVGDVRDPQPIRSGRPEAALDEVVGNPDPGHADRGAAALARRQPGDAGGAHQSLHALSPDTDPVRDP